MVGVVKPGASWRDSARPARFWIFDASAAFPLVFMLFNITWWTFAVVVFVMLFLKLLDYKGYKVIVFGRLLRNFIAGPAKIAVPWWL